MSKSKLQTNNLRGFIQHHFSSKKSTRGDLSSTTFSITKSGAGFTLVELLIAISILIISVMATFGAVSNNLHGANFSQDQMTAYYLADEGIEYVRNVRDNNGIVNQFNLGAGLPSIGWLTGIAQSSGDPCFNGATCKVDSPLGTLTSCGGTCPALKFDSSTGLPTSGLYGYITGNTTQFTRTITVTITSATEAVVNSTVSWSTNSVPETYTLSEILRAWQ